MGMNKGDDPGQYTVGEVQQYLQKADDAEVARVVEAERAGKGRTGILESHSTATHSKSDTEQSKTRRSAATTEGAARGSDANRPGLDDAASRQAEPPLRGLSEEEQYERGQKMLEREDAAFPAQVDVHGQPVEQNLENPSRGTQSASGRTHTE